MSEDYKYYLYCSHCSHKRYTNGFDLVDLVEIKRVNPMRLVPKVDKYTKKMITPPDVKRPKMFRCPKCGFTLKGFSLQGKQLEANDEQTDNTSRRQAGPEGP